MQTFTSIPGLTKNKKSGSAGYSGRKPLPFFQPKLTINQPGDMYEQEADAVANKIMRMPATSGTRPLFFQPRLSLVTPVQKKCSACEQEEKLQRKDAENEEELIQLNPAKEFGIQRKCDHCEEEEKLQLKAESGGNVGITASSAVHKAIHSGGHALDTGTRSFMESRFGYDFSNVQIHNDSLAHKSSADINALAYTHGNHVVFGEGLYQPNTHSGKQLLAHELAHVMQQGGSIVKRKTNPADKIKKAKERQEKCWSRCGGKESGSADCELGPDGLPTDKVVTTINETDPCIKPCVEVHESVHVKDMKQICKKVHDCLKKSKGDEQKADKCLDTYEGELYTKVVSSECNAYKKEIDCLNKVKSKKECVSSESKSNWAVKIKLSKCYRDCYCVK